MARDWDDPSLPWHVRLDRALGWRDTEFLRKCLIEPEARFGAAHRLGELGATDAVPELLRALNANDDGFRITVIKALTDIGDPAVIPALREIAEHDEAFGVRSQAVSALADLGDPQGVALLAAVLVNPRRIMNDAERFQSGLPWRPRERTHMRWLRRWAAKRLVELHAVDVVPILRAAIPGSGWRERLRLRRTIRKLSGE